MNEMDLENTALENMVEKSGVAVRRMEADALEAAMEEGETFLQSRTISLNEVRKNLPLWIPPFKDEIGNFDSNQAIQRVTEEEAMTMVQEAEDQGRRAEIIPGMGGKSG